MTIHERLPLFYPIKDIGNFLIQDKELPAATASHYIIFQIFVCCSMRVLIFVFVLTLFGLHTASGQKKLALSFDDVPNTQPDMAARELPALLRLIDSLQVPAAVFINEGKLKTIDSVSRKPLLEAWAVHPLISLGNHTNGHERYSTTAPDTFWQSVIEGERLSRPLAQQNDKELRQFRFPFNDLGADSAQQAIIRRKLSAAGYQITPFTLESADWMFDALYRHYLQNQQPEEAKRVGQAFVQHTLKLLQHFDSLSQHSYSRNMNQIYLGHDNLLHVHYLPELIKGFTAAGYRLVSLEEALSDPAYQQKNAYYKKWGISWLYRWMEDPAERRAWMLAEPSLEAIQQEFDNL